jgi:EAL domain-containing protein (putative c-di-GMP-specific phosphodiesterase class I)/GGDEF domain-containing protein
MQPLPSIAKLRRPRGLAARAAIFTALLIVVTGALSAGLLIWGAAQESKRQQLAITQYQTQTIANMIAEGLQRGGDLRWIDDGVGARDRALGVTVRNVQNEIIFESGSPLSTGHLSARVLTEGGPVQERQSNGDIVVAAPIFMNEQLFGAVVVSWGTTSLWYEPMRELAPFLLMLILVGIAAIPITAFIVRRAVAPLEELTQFAERVAEDGQVKQIEIRTGDEFETLANAFNQMISRLDASMRQIQEIAFVDPITQLPNQDRFVREVDHFIAQHPSEAGVVAVFELQRLPKLMQMLDHDAARDFLRVVAERLITATRTVDRLMRLRGKDDLPAATARFSTVEFAVFAPGVSSPSEAIRFAQHLNAALSQPFDWRGHKLTLGACCGVALAPRDGRDADAVIRHARMALGVAAAAPGRLKVFTPSLDREAMARLTLEREMRGALENNEFRAYFQPKINLATGRIEACEALARWVRPDRTIISPGRFIPVAEESGLIGVLSDAIMREACWKAAAWARAGLPTNVSVNVSALQFQSDRFAENVLRIVQNAGLAPQRLELEITESVVMEDPERALKLIGPLREAGVRMAIDDFGCGHSSLAALSKLPFDVIKIDQQFVRALERGDEQAAAIIEMILALSKTLNLEVVAEGVERRDEVEFMAKRGCHWAQGFLYGAAVSAPEFAELLRRQAGEEVVVIDAA